MTVIEPCEIPSRTLTWKPMVFLSHIKRRSNQCECNAFVYDTLGDHLQYCQTKSAVSQVHDLVVYRLGVLLGSVGHRVKIHNITPETGKERGDLEIKDYLVIQKPQTQDNRHPPPHTLILDYTMTHIRFGTSHVHPMVQLTNTRRSDGAPDPDGSLKEVARIKIRYYRNPLLESPGPHRFHTLNRGHYRTLV